MIEIIKILQDSDISCSEMEKLLQLISDEKSVSYQSGYEKGKEAGYDIGYKDGLDQPSYY